MPEKKVEKEKQTFLKEIILLFVIKYLQFQQENVDEWAIFLRVVQHTCSLLKSRLCVGQFSVKQHLLYQNYIVCEFSSQCLKITKNVSFRFFQFWLIPPIFVLLKVTYLVTLFVRTVSFMFSKTRHNRQFWHFPLIFVLVKVTYLVTLFDRKFSKNRQNEHFLIFLMNFWPLKM